MKKHKHFIIITFLIIVCIFTLLACNKKPSKTIRSSYDEYFEMYVTESSKLTDNMVKCSVKVVYEKENDITNKNDYDGGNFKKYSYLVSIEGTIDKIYAGREVRLFIVFIPDYHQATGFKGNEWGIVSEDGTFSYSYSLYSNAILTEWVPYKFELL